MRPERTLIAYLYAKPEKRDELLKILHGFVKPTRDELGCVDYHLHVSDEDPNLFIFHENWRTHKEPRLRKRSYDAEMTHPWVGFDCGPIARGGKPRRQTAGRGRPDGARTPRMRRD